MIIARLLAFIVFAAVFAVGASMPAAAGEVVFRDTFDRDDADAPGNDWVSLGKVVLQAKAAFFAGKEEEFRPRLTHRFPPQKAGKVTVSFVMDWLREAEKTWSLHVQLGNSADMPRLLVHKQDLSKGVGVNLLWGGGEPVGAQPAGSFGSVKNGEFRPLFVVNDKADEKTVVEKPVVAVEIDIDAATYTVSFNGQTYPDLPFDNKVPLDTIRFVCIGCSAAGFSKSSIDDVTITRVE